MDVNKFMNSYEFLYDLKQRELNDVEKLLKNKKIRKKLKEDEKIQLKGIKGNRKQELKQITKNKEKMEVKKQIK